MRNKRKKKLNSTFGHIQSFAPVSHYPHNKFFYCFLYCLACCLVTVWYRNFNKFISKFTSTSIRSKYIKKIVVTHCVCQCRKSYQTYTCLATLWHCRGNNATNIVITTWKVFIYYCKPALIEYNLWQPVENVDPDAWNWWVSS